jgi:SAM-dependent methyltransferase
MKDIYQTHSGIYEMMYKTFINYDEEYAYYNTKLKAYNARSVIELGCGTGNLAGRFIEDGFNYTGIDLNRAMLDLAERKNPGAVFLEADMRNFELPEPGEACIITARSVSYLVTNEDAMNAFKKINNNLQSGGILCFDNIDASKFIPLIKNGKNIVHKAEYNGRKFQRESHWSVNPSQSWAFNWDSIYFEERADGSLEKIVEDNSVVRCFTRDDLCLFLELCNFTVKQIEDRPCYAFDTFVITAQKNS